MSGSITNDLQTGKMLEAESRTVSNSLMMLRNSFYCNYNTWVHQYDCIACRERADQLAGEEQSHSLPISSLWGNTVDLGA